VVDLFTNSNIIESKEPLFLNYQYRKPPRTKRSEVACWFM